MSEATPPADIVKRTVELRTVELPTPEGVIRGQVGITAGPLALAGLVKVACALTDALVQWATEQEVGAGRTVSCAAGCGACCRHMVPISPPEALAIVDLIDGLDPARRQPVLAQFDHVVGVLEEHDMIAELLKPSATDEAVLPVARQYFNLQLACPFLVDESCGI
ncbi:MAG: hypothetical protein ABIG44_18780, partial [Planctomycetota bacterium]